MNAPRTITLVRRSLRHYWRINLGVLIGTAVACAVLTGALAVGDSVRGTLRSIADARLGRIDAAILPGDRFFRIDLADDIQPMLTDGLRAAPVMLSPAAAATPDETHRANVVQLLGVDERFFSLSPGGTAPAPQPGEVFLNRDLARQLNVRIGDDILLLTPRPSLLPREAALARTDDATLVLRRRVSAIVDTDSFGRFGMQADQVAPLNAFVNLAELARDADQPGRANAMLIGRAAGSDGNAPTDAIDAVQAALEKHITLKDLGLDVRRLPTGRLELRSGRVFLSPPVAEAARSLDRKQGGVLTYLVNRLQHGERSTPYSMVSALDANGFFRDILPADLADDEIVINSWLADDLAASPGDEITLTYFVLDDRNRLLEQSRTFRVKAVVPLDGPAGDATLMPDFPGIAEEPNCRDWDAGIPIDFARIRDKDEAYWDTHRGTPKAFVSLAAGQRMWANRFGSLTAVRFEAEATTPAALGEQVLDGVDVRRLGFFARDVRGRAEQAVSQSLDFGGLFIGLSMFLIVAAVLLTALLFVFGVQQRAGQIGTLRAVGWGRRRVLRLLMVEGGLLAAGGCVLGVWIGLLYTQAMVALLSGVWAGAVASFSVEFHVTLPTVIIGGAASFAVAMGAMWLTLRRAMKLSARRLLAGEFGRASSPRQRRWPAAGAVICLLAAAALVIAMRGATGMAAAGVFFGAGALVLAGGLLAMAWRLGGQGHSNSSHNLHRPCKKNLTFWRLAMRGPRRRVGRSLACIGLLAAGVFLTVSIRAFHIDPAAQADRRDSGTGGFVLYAESALPIYDDLNSPAGREKLRLPQEAMRGVSVVPMRLQAGDDASCLNLNRAQQPRILGVNPADLASRDAFTFVAQADNTDSGWDALRTNADDLAGATPTIPAIADEPTLTWALGKKVGETLAITDGRGRAVRLRFVGAINSSILQGNVLIDEQAFTQLFPDAGGWQVFLMDVASPDAGRTAEVAAAMSRAMADEGLAVTPTVRRLGRFADVQNTYLRIFTVLGGLGLLLGSGGFGIVVLRNVFERRGELALLRAVGYTRAAVRRLVLGEHLLLLAAGLVLGGVAALVAIAPAAGSGRTMGASLMALAAVGAGLTVSGTLWVAVAAAVAVRGRLLSALRTE